MKSGIPAIEPRPAAGYTAGSARNLAGRIPDMSPSMTPRQRWLALLARKHGAHVMYHTDGAARVVIPAIHALGGRS